MKSYLFLLLIVVSTFSCNKSDNSSSGNPPAETKITYTVDSASTEPGMFLTLKASGLITKDTCTVELGVKSVFLTKIDSLHYFVLTPVLSPGTYKLDLKNLDAGNSPEVIVRKYASISNPDAVFAAGINNYNKLADSLLINSLTNAVDSTDITFMHQLMDQLTQNIVSCTSEEKLSLAYQFQNMNLDNAFAQKDNLDTAYLVSRLNGVGDEISSIMTAKALWGNRNLLAAIATIPAVVATAYWVAKAPGPVKILAIISFGIAVARLVYYAEAAIKTNGEAISIPGVALDNMSEVDGNGKDANPVPASNNQSVLQKLISKFRTLRKSDETGLNNDISDFIKGTYYLEEKSNSIKSIFDNIKNTFSTYFDKITIPYSPYVSPVLAMAKEKIVGVKSEFVSVTNVSNSNITVSAVDDGANGLRLTFNNPGRNITTETNFTFQLDYTQAAINNKISITEQAKFSPDTDLVLTSPPDETVFHIPAGNTGVAHVIFTWTGDADLLELWIPGPGPQFFSVAGSSEFSIDLGSSPDWYWRVRKGYSGPTSRTGHFSVVY